MTLYIAKQLPDRWIAEDEDGELVSWPAVADGWEQRTPYRGHRRALVEVDARNAYGTGWPGVPGRGRPPRALDGATERISLRATADEIKRWQAAALDREVSLAELIRGAVERDIKR